MTTATDPVYCEAETTKIASSGLIPPCERKARGERTMICRSGFDVLPVLPACGYHLRRKVAFQWEGWV